MNYKYNERFAILSVNISIINFKCKYIFLKYIFQHTFAITFQ